jgi:hypothetical protein
MKNIVANKKINCEHILGHHLDESHYDVLIDEDCNMYSKNYCYDIKNNDCEKVCSNCEEGTREDNILFVLRKNFFTLEEQRGALEGLQHAAKVSHNRGLATGQSKNLIDKWVDEKEMQVLFYLFKDDVEPVEDILGIDPIDEILKSKRTEILIKGYMWKHGVDKVNIIDWAREAIKLSPNKRKEEAQKFWDSYIAKGSYADRIFSGVAGWYDRYPRTPYGRATEYTKNNYELFSKSFPFLKKLSESFKENLPNRYREQSKCISKIDSRFHIPDTVFTTITVNRTFRTAAHRDAGDLSRGFSNLSVLSNGIDYTGGYLVLPEYRAAINVRPGDLLLINNHEAIHGNTEINVLEGGERYSIVCYFREGMLELGSKEYEDCRYDFVEAKRKEKNDRYFNGVTEGMFKSSEWYDFCKDRLGQETLDKYHPEQKKEVDKIDFFE